MSFLLPLLVWAAVSYLPFLWHPLVKVSIAGDSAWVKAGAMLDRKAFAEENTALAAKGLRQMEGKRSNPVFLPPPHAVAKAFYTAFQTPPVLRGDVWLHESLASSINTIFWGFTLSTLIGLPLGILCGAYAFWSRISEPVIDFIRYMPAPAFGALAVAILGINGAPKIAIIFIGTFFQQVLVVANTVRRADPTLVEAAQTLGARGRRLLLTVVVPSKLSELYTDTRILLGWAWTYLVVAEVVGVSSGITFFINQQAKYRNFENVYAAIIMIGLLGLATDQFLAFIGRHLFPWEQKRRSRILSWIDGIRGKMPAPPVENTEAG
ncbi:MAG: ABC transporter permease [Opitutaceae bacterium]|nr:ABC transporter permease [Opitutaceae bacterium]